MEVVRDKKLNRIIFLICVVLVMMTCKFASAQNDNFKFSKLESNDSFTVLNVKLDSSFVLNINAFIEIENTLIKVDVTDFELYKSFNITIKKDLIKYYDGIKKVHFFFEVDKILDSDGSELVEKSFCKNATDVNYLLY